MEQATLDRLAFFGRMNAHISHEIKNILATISETSGLLLDIMELAGVEKLERGGRMIELCERVVGLVDRGNATVRNMNRFAHSVDEPVTETDLAELLELTASLAAYMPYNRKVNLVVRGKAVLTTRPFLLMNLLYEGLARIFPDMDMKAEATLTLAAQDGGARITLSPGPGELPATATDLAEPLNAAVNTGPDRLEIALSPCPE